MVVVAGSINLDLVARVARLPAPGETVPGTSFETAAGGKGANQAVAARRAGADVRFVGAVGTDANAGPALSNLRADGIDLAAVRQTSDAPTGVALILVDSESGENQIAVVPGANGTLDAGAATAAALQPGDVLALQMEIPADANAALLAAAEKAGALSLLNIAPFAPEAADLAAAATMTIANETEFDLLATALSLEGADRAGRAADFVARTGRTVIITLGPDGAMAATPDGLVHADAPVIRPVDTVGAGDTFCGYLAAALAAGQPLADAMALACRAGALACLKSGAQASIPERREVEAFNG